MSLPLTVFIGIWVFAVGAVASYQDPFDNRIVGSEGVDGAYIFSHMVTDKKVVAMTFDDGPDPRWTPYLLDSLIEHDATATFFVLGKNVTAHPGLARDVAEAGMEIANHTYDHVDLRDISLPEQLGQIEECSRAIEARGLDETGYFRPPKGHLPFGSGRAIRAAGHTTVFWDVSVERTEETDDEIVERVLSSVRPGSILLAHDGGIPNRAKTVRVIPRILEGLSAMGYDVVSVGELLESY